jgi:hypothetical protein
VAAQVIRRCASGNESHRAAYQRGLTLADEMESAGIASNETRQTIGALRRAAAEAPTR